MKRSVVLIIVDSLRYDIVADEPLRAEIAPTLDGIIRTGQLAKIVANASNTQFVMPTLLTGTYPMDFGGYNTGITGRPPSIAEHFLNAGFHTSLYSNCVLYNRNLGFSRGFQHVLSPVNSRRSLTQDIEYRILPFLNPWKEGKVTDADVIAFLKSEYHDTLQNIFDACQDAHRIPAEFPILRERDKDLAARSLREIQLLKEAPLAVAEKLVSVPEAFYWTVLGDRKPGLKLFAARVWNRVWDQYAKRAYPKKYASGLFDAFDVLTDEVEPSLGRMMQTGHGHDGRGSFQTLHIMDVHTPRILINQVGRVPSIIRTKERVYDEVPLANTDQLRGYLGAVKTTDQLLARLLQRIKDLGNWENTAVFITSDHGTTLPERDGMPVPDLPNRFEPQDLAVPVIATGGLCEAPPLSNGLFDSRDLGATLLQAGGLPAEGFGGGRPMTDPDGRDGVVAENGGRGRLDLKNGDLNFKISGKNRGILVRLSGSELSIIKRWGPEDDPRETDEFLLSVLRREREDILKSRGVPNA